MILDPNKRYTVSDKEYPTYISTLFIKRLIKEFPNQDIEVVIKRECINWKLNTFNILMKTAIDMYTNNEI